MADQQEELLDKIKNLIPINGLSDNYQRQLIKQSRLFKYPRGKVIFKQGERDNYSYYVLKGQVEMDADGSLVKRVEEESEAARTALAQLQPRQMTARATVESVLVRVDRELLNKLLALDTEVQEVVSADDEAEDTEVDWMSVMLDSELFARIPAANIQRIFSLMEEVEFEPGDRVVSQGEPGDYYYIIQSGRCMVLRTTEAGKEVQLAELDAGASFGEEALVSEAKRNASVVMLTRGCLMRLTKEDFAELIKKPVLESVSYEDGVSRVEAGDVWLDIRLPEEHSARSIPGSINISLRELRQRAGELDPEKNYIVYSEVGSRSSVAAYLLNESGINASYLEAGFMSTPFGEELPTEPVEPGEPHDATDDDSDEEITEINYQQENLPQQAVDEEPATSESLEEEPEMEIDAGVKAASLKAELAKADMQIKEAENLKGVVENARRQMEAELEEKMRLEREKMNEEAQRVNRLFQEAQRMKDEIAQAKLAAEKEVEEKRQQEETRIRQLQAAAEKRLREEEEKLEQVYAKNTEDLLRVQQMKEKAAAELEERNRLLKQESEANKQQLEEAKRLKQAAEDKLQQQIREQEEVEERLRKEAEERINRERKKLEGEFARTTQQLQQAQRARVAAEMARRAATQEAEQIISELKTSHSKSRLEGEEKLQQEKQSLEEEAQRIKDELRLTQQARQEAEAARRKAEREVEKLNSLQQAVEHVDSEKTVKLQDEIKVVEQMAEQAREQLESARQAEQAAADAQIINNQEMKRTDETSAELRRMIEQDIGSWMEEQERFENSTNQREENIRMMEQMKRIAKSAELAANKAKQSEQSLFDDLAAFRESED